MAKVTVRDAILANVVGSILFAIAAAVWTASALLKSNATATFAPLPKSPAQTLYSLGRCELLRDVAMNCEKSFNQLIAAAFDSQVRADWMTAVVALWAFGMLVFNIWLLRRVGREMDTMRSNSLMQPTGQERAGG